MKQICFNHFYYSSRIIYIQAGEEWWWKLLAEKPTRDITDSEDSSDDMSADDVECAEVEYSGAASTAVGGATSERAATPLSLPSKEGEHLRNQDPSTVEAAEPGATPKKEEEELQDKPLPKVRRLKLYKVRLNICSGLLCLPKEARASRIGG